MPSLILHRLRSGGVITNYFCTSACRHCLYGCSPHWPRHYISEETLRRLLRIVRSLGCGSVHIGGGEPFLNAQGLAMVLRTARDEGVGVDYVETNSSWYRGLDEACRLLEELRKAGLRTLLVSMSPFHNEHIPFHRVKGVLEACQRTGVGVFPWIQAFYPEIDALDDRKTHDLEAYESRYGPGYLAALPSRYWIHPGGRALKTFARVMETAPAEDILAAETGGCRELLDTSHFHVDLYGRYIPGLCSGLALDAEDLGKPVPADEYPLLDLLFREGVRGLYRLAEERHGYSPSGTFLNKCHLCFDMRQYLAKKTGGRFKELHPGPFYEQV